MAPDYSSRILGLADGFKKVARFLTNIYGVLLPMIYRQMRLPSESSGLVFGN
jgi:hypothetical protein